MRVEAEVLAALPAATIEELRARVGRRHDAVSAALRRLRRDGRVMRTLYGYRRADAEHPPDGTQLALDIGSATERAAAMRAAVLAAVPSDGITGELVIARLQRRRDDVLRAIRQLVETGELKRRYRKLYRTDRAC